MPYSDPAMRAAQQQFKWRVWREMADGFALRGTCQHCQLPIYALDPARHTDFKDRWVHFIDPVGLGIRPFGKNEPVYDLVRRCDVALRHRYLPEGNESWDGKYVGLDPRVGAYRDLAELLETKLRAVSRDNVAEP